MKIKEIDIADAGFRAFAEKYGSIFLHADWLALYDSNLKVYVLKKGEELIGVFLLYEFKKIGLTFCIPPPFSPYNCLTVKNDVDKEECLKTVLAFISQKKAIVKKLAFDSSYFDFAYSQNSFTRTTGHTYVIPIHANQNVQANYLPKRRQQIRRALKDEVVVKKICEETIFLNLVKLTFQRQGKKIDFARVAKIVSKFLNHSNAFAYCSYLNEVPLTAYLCIHDNSTAYYILGGYNEEKKHIGAGPLAMDACIQEARNRKLMYFDFEGSMVPSIARYFKEFGGELHEYPVYQSINSVGKIIVKLKKMVLK